MAIIELAGQEGFITRIREIASTGAPWHRRLWRCSTLQLVRELLDESVTAGVPETAVLDLRRYALHSVKSDQGIGSQREVLGRAVDAIKPGITTSSYAWLTLAEHLRRADREYLNTWANVFETGRPVDVEGVARRVAAHILDSGYHKNSLYAWLGALHKNTCPATVPEFLADAAKRLAQPEREFTFCVPVVNPAPSQLELAHGWMTATETAAWRRKYAPRAGKIRSQGGFLIRVVARDINSAAERTRARLSDLEAKFQMGSRNPIQIAPWMWSQEKGRIMPAQATNRMLDVHAFEREGELATLQMPEFMTSVLALLQPVRTAAAHIAIMSGWSAIESLLVGPDDHDIVAAERFSLVVAASMPRAELTTLADSYRNSHEDGLASELSACSEDLDRAKRFARHLCSGAQVVMNTDADNLAIRRLGLFLATPREAVKKTADILTREFVRFYRKRNLIAHGGRTHTDNSVHAMSETVSPLIGAGVDQFITAGIKHGAAPIALAAIGAANLNYLRPATATDAGNLLDMLEIPRL